MYGYNRLRQLEFLLLLNQEIVATHLKAGLRELIKIKSEEYRKLEQRDQQDNICKARRLMILESDKRRAAEISQEELRLSVRILTGHLSSIGDEDDTDYPDCGEGKDFIFCVSSEDMIGWDKTSS
ncbi:hypothetical protein JTB14_030590 [Gonioctena quinquepunctata]|nr:hypothetical protein JTB14_030590 [Gonioctena quinquepunctata]